jgi:hypothetical protein
LLQRKFDSSHSLAKISKIRQKHYLSIPSTYHLQWSEYSSFIWLLGQSDIVLLTGKLCQLVPEDYNLSLNAGKRGVGMVVQ